MSRGIGKAKSLQKGVFFDPSRLTEEQHYVYYRDLRLYHPRGGFYIYKTARRVADQIYKENHNSSYIRSIAEAEQKKEQALLQQHFGVTETFNLDNEDDVRGLLDAVNMNIGLQSIYERNIAIINAGNQKDSFSWVGAHLMQLLESQDIRKKIINILVSGNQDTTTLLTQLITDTAFTAIDDYLFDANNNGPNSLKNFDDYKKAYIQLQSILNSSNTEFAKRIQQIYQIPQLVEAFKALTPDKIASEYNNITKSRKGINTVAKQGGLLLEEIVAASIQKTLKAHDLTGGSARIGNAGYRADTIATIDFDLSPILDQIEQTPAKNRAEAQRLFQNIEKSLQNSGNSGFIIYTSEKNYTLNNTHGFQAGDSMTLAGYEELMSDIGNNVTNGLDTLIGSIVNTAKGAVLESQKANISAYIARDVGKFLFDDWTIQYGEELANTSASVQSIHLMNLNGIYIPMSVILFKLANAIELEEGSLKAQSRIASANITTPDLLYYKEGASLEEEWYKKQYAEEGITPAQAWFKQAKYAYDNTKISIHFLKDFGQMIRDMYKGG